MEEYVRHKELTKKHLKSVVSKLEEMTAEGKTIEEAAAELGIAVSTFYFWNKKYPEIKNALKLAREFRTQAVIQAAFKRAIGYKSYEVRKEKIAGIIKEVSIIKEIPPDMTAISFLLKNISPNEWNEKLQVEEQGQLQLVYDSHAIIDVPEKPIENDSSTD
ncbi:MAG: hypothetical protein LBT46_02890 [Planctomycetaceae bacterium]|jgi:DNA-binding NarL/FixJ family response regulator|nr:hypothetical protein [Planctomycetaceae bacterium]